MRTVLFTMTLASALGMLLGAQGPDKIQVVLPRDAIPAIDAPEFQLAPKAFWFGWASYFPHSAIWSPAQP